MNPTPVKQKVKYIERPLSEVIQAALNLIYEHDPIAEPEFEGLTNREVMVLRLVKQATKYGDMKAFDRVADRLEGKPRQIQETFKSDKTYLEYLQELADEEYGTTPNGHTLEIDSQPSDQQLPLLREEVSEGETEDGAVDPFSIE